MSDTATNLDHLDAQQLREMVQSLMGQVQANKLEIQRRDHEIAFKQAAIDKLTHEMAVLKRLKFAAKSEAFTAEQKSLLEESIDADLAALERELEQIAPAKTAPQDKQQPKRQVLPVNLPRREIHHEPQSATCACGCRLERIGEDVSEKLDYQRRVHGGAPRSRQVGMRAVRDPDPGTGGAAHHRQGHPHGRTAGPGAGGQVPRSPAAVQARSYLRPRWPGRPSFHAGAWVGQCGVQLQPLVDALKREMLEDRVLHADETPVAMLKPGNGKTHRAYLWSYCTTAYSACVPWCSTSPKAAAASMPEPSSVSRVSMAGAGH